MTFWSFYNTTSNIFVLPLPDFKNLTQNPVPDHKYSVKFYTDGRGVTEGGHLVP